MKITLYFQIYIFALKFVFFPPGFLKNLLYIMKMFTYIRWII